MSEHELQFTEGAGRRLARRPDAAEIEVDRWMGILAHELRQPLNTVVLALDASMPDRGPSDAEWSPGDLARAAARQMQRIIEDVLDLCRHRNGRLPSRMDVVDLVEVVVAAVNVARPMLMTKGHLLVVSVPDERVLIKGHRCRLEQVLTNLLVNAGDYTRDGGHILLTVEPAGGAVVIRVRDNGVGIPATLLPYVFDHYRRGTADHGHASGGLGIGLALVKTFVESHGGTVSVHSDGCGMGSEFAVRLPGGVC